MEGPEPRGPACCLDPQHCTPAQARLLVSEEIHTERQALERKKGALCEGSRPKREKVDHCAREPAPAPARFSQDLYKEGSRKGLQAAGWGNPVLLFLETFTLTMRHLAGF